MKLTTLAIAVSLSLSGCAVQPIQPTQEPITPTAQEAIPIDPRFLEAAVPMEPVVEPVTYTTPQTRPNPQTQTMRNLPLDQCRQLLVNQVAMAMTTTKAIHTCLALPKESMECQAVLAFNELRPVLIGGSDEEILACADKVEAAGLAFPPGTSQVAKEFSRAVRLYKLKLGV